MNKAQRDIRRKKLMLEYAARIEKPRARQTRPLDAAVVSGGVADFAAARDSRRRTTLRTVESRETQPKAERPQQPVHRRVHVVHALPFPGFLLLGAERGTFGCREIGEHRR